MADEGDASAAWGAAVEAKEPPSDPIQDALKKEAQIRDIVGLQESLRGLMSRIAQTEASTDKLKTENEMLDVYIANLTKSSAIGGGQVINAKR